MSLWLKEATIQRLDRAGRLFRVLESAILGDISLTTAKSASNKVVEVHVNRCLDARDVPKAARESTGGRRGDGER
jgi:hypothetical protein